MMRKMRSRQREEKEKSLQGRERDQQTRLQMMVKEMMSERRVLRLSRIRTMKEKRIKRRNQVKKELRMR